MKKLFLLTTFVFFALAVPAQKFNMGTPVAPDGETVTVDSQSIMFNGKRVIPVMGEMHYARVPENRWRDELLKMKANGVNIVSTYLFWIHHEEVEGQFDWSGCRNLHKYVQLCKQLGLKVFLRIGPFVHGEARNGGFPDWMVKGGYPLRTTDERYLKKVTTWYSEVFNQVRGMMWKDGGPVVGIQFDNEFSGTWEYFAALKKIATNLGFDAPIYTRTGWSTLSTSAVYGEIIPVYGNYCDAFWGFTMKDMPESDLNGAFFFKSYRNAVVLPSEKLPDNESEQADAKTYPFLTCELGGGMATSYQRRIYVYDYDDYAIALIKIANGCNMPGYFMFHGGINPEGRLSYYNEQLSAPFCHDNDLTHIFYDFEAPISLSGQLKGQYFLLKELNLFLNESGSELAGYKPYFPVKQTDESTWDKALRWNYRSDGHSGFVFVNNYQRMTTLTRKDSVNFTVPIDGQNVTFPSKKISVKYGETFLFPFNLKINDVTLRYAMAQPITAINVDGVKTYFFKKIDGIEPEYSVGSKIKTLKLGMNKLSGKARIYLVDEAAALNLWKTRFGGKDYIALSKGSVRYDADSLVVEDNADTFNVSFYPAPKGYAFAGCASKVRKNGIFTEYQVNLNLPVSKDIVLTQTKEAGKLRKIVNEKSGKVEQPSDEDFNDAAVFEIKLDNALQPMQRAVLQVDYSADVARVYRGEKLIMDNFYNGRPLSFDVSDMPANTTLDLKILPFQPDAKIYVQKGLRPGPGIHSVAAKVLYYNRIVFCPKSAK